LRSEGKGTASTPRSQIGRPRLPGRPPGGVAEPTPDYRRRRTSARGDEAAPL